LYKHQKIIWKGLKAGEKVITGGSSDDSAGHGGSTSVGREEEFERNTDASGSAPSDKKAASQTTPGKADTKPDPAGENREAGTVPDKKIKAPGKSMFVDFFIDRPIFAGVISIVISLAGAVCIILLPVAQFPEITPPTVQVQATYTGANAEVVEKTVTTPIEEQINGVEGMTYMSSISSSDGTSNITVTFDVGYDLDIAAVDVQNRVTMAQPQVPEDVTKYGITTKKQSPDFVLIICLYSENGEYDDLFLSNYAAINIVDRLKRLPGVGDVQIFGEKKYAMRLWLNPDKLTSMDMTAMDVINAVQEQNVQVAAGSIGQAPSPPGQVFTYSINTLGRLSTPNSLKTSSSAPRKTVPLYGSMMWAGWNWALKTTAGMRI
jgi:hypothetical protein